MARPKRLANQHGPPTAYVKLIVRVPMNVYDELASLVTAGPGGMIGQYVRKAVANQLESDMRGGMLDIPQFLPVRGK